MADVELAIGGRTYAIACRDGGEDHLRTLAAHVDAKAHEAAAAVGGMNEARRRYGQPCAPHIGDTDRIDRRRP
jgi:cell division protein ZapA